jgi:hypothetical protein
VSYFIWCNSLSAEHPRGVYYFNSSFCLFVSFLYGFSIDSLATLARDNAFKVGMYKWDGY